jgi:hypothetical protein
MRCCEIIVEARLFRSINPTKSQLQALLRSVQREATKAGHPDQGILRGVVTDDRLIVWNGWVATHQDMGYGHVRDNDPTYLIEIDDAGVHPSLARQADLIRQNSHVRRAYGGEPPIVLDDLMEAAQT